MPPGFTAAPFFFDFFRRDISLRGALTFLLFVVDLRLAFFLEDLCAGCRPIGGATSGTTLRFFFLGSVRLVIYPPSSRIERLRLAAPMGTASGSLRLSFLHQIRKACLDNTPRPTPYASPWRDRRPLPARLLGLPAAQQDVLVEQANELRIPIKAVLGHGVEFLNQLHRAAHGLVDLLGFQRE